ncbi:hypothetical protein DFH27DRAFT_377592 [Peziza echinospora]|nr:hypothetical protein DFH27DRAFT_377592 [Peziza echinospora]
MSIQITDGTFSSQPVYHGGRGGAGNYRRASKSELASRTTTITAAPLPPNTASNKIFFGGRGGAGNAHPSAERAMFSFDEEIERDRLIHSHHAPVYSIGRGGKGNLVSCDDIATKSFYSNGQSPRNSQDDAEASPRSSTSSHGGLHGLAHLTTTFSASSLRSGADKLWERVRR